MIKKIFLALALALLPIGVFAQEFSYPFGQIAKPECRWSNWSDLTPDCKMDIPKIINGDYEKYKTNTLYRRVYSVLWGATYDYGWDSGYGSHQWVDIATSEGTPVLAISEGTVIVAGSLSGWGNTVSIKHTLIDGTIIYSNYSHLSSISIKKGDRVNQGTQIGSVGNTGNSYGNHLHFQIDTTDIFHPYYYNSCAKGKNELDVVNKWLCRSDLITNTIDPILFLENGKATSVPPTSETIEQVKVIPPANIKPATIKSRAEILEDEAQEYLKMYSIDIGIPVTGTNMTVGSTYWTDIFVRDSKGNWAKGNLPNAGLVIGYDKKWLSVLPETLVALDGWARSIGITAKLPGAYELTFSLGKTVLWKRMVFVTKKGEIIEPATIEVRAPKTLTIWSESDIYLVPKTKYGSNLLNSPYNSRFRVEVLKGKAKFCNLSHSKKTECDSNLVVESFEFGYDDVYQGYFKGKIVALDFAPIAFSVTRIWEKAPTTKTKKDIQIKSLPNLTKTNPYYESIISGLKKNWQWVKNGYLLTDTVLTTPMVKSLVSRMMAYRALKAWKNLILKAEIRKEKEAFEKSMDSVAFRTWTRGEFGSLLFAALEKNYTSGASGAPLLDETGVYKDLIRTLRSEYAFKWADGFGDRYFQGDKNITIEEALYLMGSVVKE